jgi:hypothetical protein
MLSSDNTLAIMIYVDDFTKYLAMAGLSSEVQQQLEQQAAAANEAMLPAAAATALTTSNRQAATAAAAQQLHSMVQAVAGRIPLSSACNSPGCSNLAQRSELVLVGGKSCVCARCKAARCAAVVLVLLPLEGTALECAAVHMLQQAQPCCASAAMCLSTMTEMLAL